MAIDRFSNIEEIREVDGKVRGIVWDSDDLDVLQLDLQNVSPETRPIVEIQLYSPGEQNIYVAGGVIDDFELVKDQIFINYGKACQALGIERGQFEVVVNIYNNLLGDDEDRDLYIKQVSDDRRELYIKSVPGSELDIDKYLDAFGRGAYSEIATETEIDPETGEEVEVEDEDGNPIIKAVTERPISDDIYLNFGENKLYKIINQKSWNDENDFVVRLYKPLPEDIAEKTNFWIVEQLADSYVDNINLSGPGATFLESRKLLGPNFNIDVYGSTITETDFKSWNDLLDANTSTSQQIIDRIFSGSFDDALNLDYSGFQNFVHFSSAKERIANFRYKLSLIEFYDARIGALRSATGADTNSLQGNIATNQKRKDTVLGSFDGFERWLYYEPTSSLFTHHESVYNNNNNAAGVYRADGGYIGAKPYRLEPWPKYFENGKYILHHTTASISDNWFAKWSATSSLYDSENNKSLVKTIPEHIRLDANNDQYELFVNMIGHHFDILYSHIDNLTKVYKPEEHPKLGQSKETIYQVAKSLGWTLQNGNQAEALWKYKLGVDSGSGAYQSSGSMFSKSNEAITTEVWRRIVNNLPFLLKTKGTARSIKALMNTYGIPQTLLSIREYGGPKVGEDQPLLIEDRFSYALQFLSGSVDGTTSPYIEYGPRDYEPTVGDFGFDRPGLGTQELPAQTRQFRFRPALTQSMLLMSGIQKQNGVDEDERVLFQMAVQHTGSYSGSGKYGRIVISQAFCGGTLVPFTASTAYVPLYDGEFWNVRWFWTSTGSNDPGAYNSIGNLATTYHIQVQKASDYISDKIVHETSASYTPIHENHKNAWMGVSFDNNHRRIRIGGHPGKGSTKDQRKVNTYLRRFIENDDSISFTNANTPNLLTYSGSMQEYREWLEDIGQKTFDIHTTNPTSYVSGLSPTSSFDTLVRHYPLGTDLNAVDHSLNRYKILSSSHPAQTVLDAQEPIATGSGFKLTDALINSGSSFASMSFFQTTANAQRGNYIPVEETYYIQGVSLGANLPRSQKIRFDDNELVRRLTPTNTAEKSRFDRAPIDTNRLGLFYSVADQINKDIFNNIGDVALDDFVGDPDHQTTFNYPDLLHFSKHYWKKFTDKNDLNAFIKIFSQFDFSLFESIKQLLPERVDEAMGVLVEPHALERVKVKLHDHPEQESLHYEGTVSEHSPTASGEIIPLAGTIDKPVTINGTSVYHKGVGGYSDSGNYLAVLSGSNSGLPGGDPYEPVIYKYINKIFPYKIAPVAAAALSLPLEITSSQHPLTVSATGSVILQPRLSTIFKLDVLHYSGSINLDKRTRNAARVVSESLGGGLPSIYNYSRSMDETAYRDDFFAQTNNLFYEGCRLTGPGINLASTVNAIDQRPVIEVFETNPNTLVFTNAPNVSNPGTLEVR